MERNVSVLYLKFLKNILEIKTVKMPMREE
jgi:hypothetical protein